MKRLEWIPMMPRREKEMNIDINVLNWCQFFAILCQHFHIKNVCRLLFYKFLNL